MKKFNLLFFILLFFVHNSMSQTVVGTVTQTPCNYDGIYTVSTTGFSLPLTYSYSIGGSSIVHANVNSMNDQLINFPMDNSGAIFVHVTDGTLSASTWSSYTPSISFSTSVTNPTCPQTSGTITATQTNSSPGPFNFVWTNVLSSNTYTGNNITVPLGEYSVMITDVSTGCVLEIADSAAYVEQISPISVAMSSTDANCTNGTATAVGSGGTSPYTYQWMNGANTQTITGLVQNYYTVILTDAQGCQSANSGISVQQNPVISVNTSPTNTTCAQSDGSIIAFGSGGTPPYSYVWDNGQTGNTATNLSGPSYYSVITTDANGCIGSGLGYVNTNTPISVTYNTTPSDCIAPTGSATITASGGTGPYSIVWNTSPNVTGSSISNYPPGNYSFEVTDAVGCVRTGSVVINASNVINAYPQGSTVTCPNTTGNASVNVNGTNPPFTYLWSNGSTTNQITGVPIGNYTCEITDADGCSVTKNASVNSISNINIGVITTPVSCLYNTDGTATAQVTGGTPPYTYLYSNGTSSSTTTGLEVGNYSVTVVDANGCSNSAFFTITNAGTATDCYCTIEGVVYYDGNSNCVLDGSETGIENIMIHCSGQGYTFTDANGYYSFQVPTGSYTIEEQVNAYYPLSPCQTNNVSVNVVASSGCNNVVNFANSMNVIHDLKLTTINSSTPPIPGNTYQQKIIVKNMGTVTENSIQIGYENDGQLLFSNSSLPSFIQTGIPNHYSVLSGFPTLSPNSTSVILMNYSTPTNIPLGTEVDFYDSVANIAPINVNWLLDYSPWNNVNHLRPTVVSSYDPNYKEVSPKGVGPEGYISSQTKEFDYTIHFQNEGTYYAQNIYITDQLDSDLDWKTLTPGYSDYNYTTSVSETGLVTFTFSNINLPWKSAFGDALSSGLINYSISPLASSPQGTEFTNTADIFFDFNAPITTNTTLNTLNDTEAGVNEIGDVHNDSDGITIDVYPMPAKDKVIFRVNNVLKDEVATLYIFDLMGNVIHSEKMILNEGMTMISQNTSELARGNYIAKIQFDSSLVITKKIILF